MSKKLPVVTGEDLVKAFAKLDFEIRRQKGSHVSMHRERDGKRATIPVHKGRDLPSGTLRGILKDADVTVEQLLKAL